MDNTENNNKTNESETPATPKAHEKILKDRGYKKPAEANETLKTLEEENQKLKSQLMHLAADFDNYKKRATREKDDAVKYSVNKFANDLVDVLENLYRAEDSINTEELEQNNTLKQIFTGVELTKKSLIDIFEKYGIKRINPIGEPFDHNLHQAIAEVPSTSHAPGIVVQVIQAGYILHDRLIRPALVAVARNG